jgi:Domain of unknown function (DUF4124)
MRAILFTLFSIACAVAFSATVYKWVDENGVTHYSDQPHENAEKVQLAQPQTYSAQRGPPQPKATPAPKSQTYSSCQVMEPMNEQNFPNVTSVSTRVQVDPAPTGGDQVVLMLDGSRVPDFPVAGGSFTISPIDRGEHSLQAVVQDSSGKVLCQSPSVTFSVTQPSLLNPTNPNYAPPPSGSRTH